MKLKNLNQSFALIMTYSKKQLHILICLFITFCIQPLLSLLNNGFHIL